MTDQNSKIIGKYQQMLADAELGKVVAEVALAESTETNVRLQEEMQTLRETIEGLVEQVNILKDAGQVVTLHQDPTGDPTPPEDPNAVPLD